MKINPYGSFSSEQIVPFGKDESRFEAKAQASFLVMEKVREIPRSEIPEKHKESYRTALSRFMHDVSRDGDAEAAQPGMTIFGAGEPIVLGNTRPKNPSKGKWIFAYPHDPVSEKR